MLKFLERMGKYLNEFEIAKPRIFWLLISFLGFFLFHEEQTPLSYETKISTQSELVIKRIRAGSQNLPFLKKKILILFFIRI